MKYEALVEYFDRELAYIRRMGREFAQKYPQMARRLGIQTSNYEDPHVERLIEAFAFLTARIQRKIDDDFSEISSALLGVLYPHLLAPIPSMAVIQFQLDPTQGRASGRTVLERGASLFSKPVNGSPCIFRTCYDVDLWPLAVSQARITTPNSELSPPGSPVIALSLELSCQGDIAFPELPIESLRFYLHGGGREPYFLYDFLFSQVTHVQLVDVANPAIALATWSVDDSLRAVGFAPNELLLPYDARSLPGFCILLEYFALPQKFLFFDVLNLAQPLSKISGNRFRLIFYSPTPYPGRAEGVTPSVFRLGCSPIVNLFTKRAERIDLHQTHYEYRVIPDRMRSTALEVYGLKSVVGTRRADNRSTPYYPFFSTVHPGHASKERGTYYYESRREVFRDGEIASEIYLSFVTLDFDPSQPPVEAVDTEVLCTNRDLPSKLPFGDDRKGDFTLERATTLPAVCLTQPTPSRRIRLGTGALWRLISHLSLNHSAIAEQTRGKENLQELLRIYDIQASQVTEQQIDGIFELKSIPKASRVVSANGMEGIARGFEVQLALDPDLYVGGSMLLFASIIEHLLGVHVAMNSFCQLSVKARGKDEWLKRWAPRTGSRRLL